jgi:hypothetical protein
MQEFKDLILGPVSAAYYAAAEFFAVLAIILSLYLHSRNRDPQSNSTPVKFSWLFLIWDNLKRIVAGQICLYLIFRFASEAIGRALTMWMAVGIGFFISLGLDQFIGWMKEKSSILQMNRGKMIDKMTNTGNKPE